MDISLPEYKSFLFRLKKNEFTYILNNIGHPPFTIKTLRVILLKLDDNTNLENFLIKRYTLKLGKNM